MKMLLVAIFTVLTVAQQSYAAELSIYDGVGEGYNSLATFGVGLGTSSTFNFAAGLSYSYRFAPKWRVYSEISFVDDIFGSAWGEEQTAQTYLLGARYQIWRWFFGEAALGYRHVKGTARLPASAPQKIEVVDDFVGNFGGGMLFDPWEPMVFGWEVNGVQAITRATRQNTFANGEGIDKFHTEIKAFIGVGF